MKVFEIMKLYHGRYVDIDVTDLGGNSSWHSVDRDNKALKDRLHLFDQCDVYGIEVGKAYDDEPVLTILCNAPMESMQVFDS